MKNFDKKFKPSSSLCVDQKPSGNADQKDAESNQ